MRRRAFQRQKRNELLWFAAGVLMVQAALGLAIDQFWPAVRDVEFAELQRTVIARRAEWPHRPLVLALGSSRTLMGLDAAQLCQMSTQGPLVLNCGLHTAGPILSQVSLRRFLRAGVRPNLVLLEIIPMALSARKGAHSEEIWKFPMRLSFQEAAGAWDYFDQPHRLILNWTTARIFPCYRHQVDLRSTLGLDAPANGLPRGRDAYGWVPSGGTTPPEKMAAMTQLALSRHSCELRQPGISPGALRAYRALLGLCREERIPVVLVIPPESSAFRELCPEAGKHHRNAVRELADEFALELVDAQNWVADDGFFDGHHMNDRGGRSYTQQLGRAVFTALADRIEAPSLRR